jgi:hypothetical protein
LSLIIPYGFQLALVDHLPRNELQCGDEQRWNDDKVIRLASREEKNREPCPWRKCKGYGKPAQLAHGSARSLVRGSKY